MAILPSRAVLCLNLVCLLGGVIGSASGACDRIQFLEDRSRGVAIEANPCRGKAAIAPGTLLHLAPGARLWLASAGAEGHQMVCQSQADHSLTLAVNQSNPPWLYSTTETCHFQKGRFVCRSSANGATTLVCVVASVTRAPMADRPRQGTSLVLRDAFSAEGLEDPAHRQAVVTELKQSATLCHRLYGVDRTYSLSWTVDPAGRVAAVEVPDALAESHPELAGCLVDLIQTFPYPRSSRAVLLSVPL